MASRGERNRNPGNIEYGPFAKSMGAVGTDGRFAIFPNEQTGIKAQEQLLLGKGYLGGGRNTITAIVNKYAPLSDNNPVTNYVSYVAQRIGIDPNKPISPADVPKVAAAMREFETGKRPAGFKFRPSQQPQARPQPMQRNPQSDAGVVNQQEPFVIGLNEAATKANERADKVEGFLGQQEQILSETSEKFNVFQQARQAREEARLAEANRIRDEQQARLLAIGDRLKPIEEKQNVFREKLNKAEQMPGIVRDFLSIFDPSYDPNALRKKIDNLSRDAATMLQAEQQQLTLNQAYLQSLEEENKDTEYVEGLAVQSLEEDAKVVGQQVATALQSFKFVQEELGAEEDLIRSQLIRRDEFLAQQDDRAITTLLAVANKNPDGVVELPDGTRIGAGLLEESMNKRQQASLARASAKLAYENNELQLAEAHDQKYVANLTLPELQKIATNNYTIDGRRLSPQLVSEAMTNLTRNAAVEAENILATSGAGDLAGNYKAFAQTIQGFNTRFLATAGPSGRPVIQELNQDLLKFNQEIDTALREAKKQGGAVHGQVMARVAQKVQAKQQEFLGKVNSLALAYVDGDEKGAQFVSSYFLNGQLTLQESAAAAAHFQTTGRMPSFLRATPQMAALQSAAAQAEANVTNEYAKLGVKVNKRSKEYQNALTDEITKLAGPRISQATGEQTIYNLPAVAKKRGHSFGAIPSNTWRTVVEQGNIQAAEEIASKYGVTPDSILAWGKTGNVPEGLNAAPEERNRILQQYAANSYVNTLRLLDQRVPTRDGIRASQSLMDYLEQPSLLEDVGRYEKFTTKHSLGGAIAGGLSNGSGVETFSQVIDSFGRAYTQLDWADKNLPVQQAQRYGSDPLFKARVIFGAIPGISEDEETALLSAIAPQIPKDPREANQVLPTLLSQAKFQDPNLQRIAKIAAKEYANSEEITNRVMARSAAATVSGSNNSNPYNVSPLGTFVSPLFLRGKE